MRPEARRATIVTVSDRVAAGMRQDGSGPVGRQLLVAAGWTTSCIVVADEAASVRDAVRTAVRSGSRLVVTTGGTGVAVRDVTPEAMEGLIERELPGIAEELRRRGASASGRALLSRGRAGIVGSALIVNLPGAPAAVRDGIPLVLSVADHVLAQIDGEDHG